jgi:thiol peroxidase
VAIEERKGAATLRGNEFTVLGHQLKPGDKAPNFSLVGAGNAEVTLNDSAGKVRLLSCVPSLDTPVCSTETMKWEQQRSSLGDVQMLTVSMDLPPAQARWCQSNDVQHKTASAHKNEQFGIDYGVLIKELRLLQRSVFVIDGNDTIRYVEYVTDIPSEPDYDKAIAAIKAASGS